MTDPKQPISGSVARLLNRHQVALNIGAEHAVEEDMLFDVVDQEGQEIKDPDTGVVLGNLDIVKARVRITAVLDKISVGTTLKERVNIGGYGFGGLNLGALTPPKYVTRHKSLELEEGFKPLPEAKSVVKVGDPVVQVIRESASLEEDQTDAEAVE